MRYDFCSVCHKMKPRGTDCTYCAAVAAMQTAPKRRGFWAWLRGLTKKT